MKKLSLILFSTILSLILITPLISFEKAKLITGKARVTDGDTIKINKKKIRLFGIDAPEKNQFCKKNLFKFFNF